MALIQLSRCDKQAVFVPVKAIVSFHGWPAGANPTYPKAASLFRYDIGQGLNVALFEDDADLIHAKIMNDPKGRKDWKMLEVSEEETMYFLPEQIEGIQGLDPKDPETPAGMRSLVVFDFAGQHQAFQVATEATVIAALLPDE